MKRVLLWVFTALFTTVSYGQGLIITSIFDGDLTGGTPKGIELYALTEIPDLGVYALGSANNGQGSDGAEFILSGTASAGDYLYITSTENSFIQVFAFAPDFENRFANINGNDAIELFYDKDNDGFTEEDVIDVYGDINVKGDGQVWDYTDSYAYRNSYTTASGNSFDASKWDIAGKDALVGMNSSAILNTIPFGTFETTEVAIITGAAGWRLLSIPKPGGGNASDIIDDTAIQGVAGGSNEGFTSNLIQYMNGGFTTPTNINSDFVEGYGFGVYFYNNNEYGSSELPIVLDVDGTDPAMDVDVDVTLKSSGEGYTLVGNPYSSNFNVNANNLSVLDRSPTNYIQNNIGFWDNTAGSYSIKDRTTPFIISPWQGFWVQQSLNGGATTLRFSINGKTDTSPTATFFSKSGVTNRGDINFTFTSENSYDEAIRLSFRETATTDYDIDDFGKMTPLLNEYAIMGFVSNDVYKSVESLPWGLKEEITIPMEATIIGLDGKFTLDWSGLDSIPDEWKLTFHDYKLGDSVDLRLESQYTFEESDPVTKQVPHSNILTAPVVKALKVDANTTRFGLSITPNFISTNSESESKPSVFVLNQNYPNPFNPNTSINYSIENNALVTLSVYNLMGQKVAELLNEVKSAGNHTISWDATGVASGMYYYRLTSDGQILTRKMTIIK